jgi:hypothetical protein
LYSKIRAGLSDKSDMTISNAAVQGIQSGEALLDRTAARVANSAQPTVSSDDQVTLASDAVALLQAKDQIAASVRAFQVGSDIRKTLLNVA